MRSTPVFIELIHSAEHANIQICRKIMALLFKQKIAPLPFAANLGEVTEVIKNLRGRGMSPGIFVINTFWAEELLEQLEFVFGQTPVLFFKRQIYSNEMQTRSGAPVNDGKQRITEVIESMNLRNSCVWTFGSKSSDDLAAKATQALIPFLNDNNFNHIRNGLGSQEMDLATALRSDPETLERMLGSGRMQQQQVPMNTPASSSASRSSGRMAVPAANVESASSVPPPSSSHLSGLHGAISQMGVSTMISMLEMEKKTGVLSLMRGDVTARIMMRKGRAIKASIKGVTLPEGVNPGAEVVYHVLSWRNGLFEFTSRDVEEPDEINLPTTSLLMEGARRMDEPVPS